MKETALTFGRGNNLIGIVGEPDNTPPKDTPAVLILNSGSLHKVGAFRLSVDLTRKLAGNGFRVLRFDLSGLGDSRLRLAKDEHEDLAVTDVREAMDCLAQRHGNRKFVLMGLCSSSDNSHRTSLVDDRIVGMVHLDGYGFRNYLYYVNHYGRRLLSRKFLARKLTNLAIADQQGRSREIHSPIGVIERKFPSIEQVEKEFALLMERDVRLLYIYTRGGESYNNYQHQLRDTFKSVDFRDRLELEYYPLADHTYPFLRSRAKAIARIVDWLNRQFGGIS